MVREKGDTRLTKKISRLNPGDQWDDRGGHGQIALTLHLSCFINHCNQELETQSLHLETSQQNSPTMDGSVSLSGDFLEQK